jgi:GNAT superfamily N-acetyltransferase
VLRPTIAVHRVSPDAVGALTQLWVSAALESGIGEEIAARAAAGGRVGEALRRPGCAAYVATVEGTPAGFVVVNARNHGLLESSSVAIDELFVLPDQRQHGIGRALVAAVATLAETEAYDRVLSNVPAADKVANRFFARLGFTSSVTRRVVPIAVLRRKLVGEDATAGVDLLLGRRRLIKARTQRPLATPAPSLGAHHRRRPVTG